MLSDKVHQELRAAVLGKEVDDAVERLVRAVGVQRGEAQVAGLGERDRVVHRLALAHFADEDHVRRLAQRVLERDLPVVGVDADFPLRDDAVPVLVDELDRVFDRDDVAVAVLVAVAEQRRHRRRLAAARRADEHHDPALGHDHVLQHRRQPQLLEHGMSVVMVRKTMPMRPCWTKALTRNRPTPGGAIAKLHSFVDSNSPACLSFITLRTSSIVCCGVSPVFDTGAMRPSTLIAGGKPAVMKRSEPFCLTRRSSSS
jgi:hypothetical protein